MAFPSCDLRICDSNDGVHMKKMNLSHTLLVMNDVLIAIQRVKSCSFGELRDVAVLEGCVC